MKITSVIIKGPCAAGSVAAHVVRSGKWCEFIPVNGGEGAEIRVKREDADCLPTKDRIESEI
jgi:hypothetical protein